MKNSSSKLSARLLASLLEKYGVRDVVVSPGSRNTPIITACDATKGLNLYPVIDERMAGFMALGLGLSTSRPVALVCTSGSAVLNYAPAVAEAYYRNIPLIVISADRPMQWIDQLDSQTIRQSGVLNNIVKKSFDLQDIADSEPTAKWFLSRSLNEALTTALTDNCGPVHINMQFDIPLGEYAESIEAKYISTLRPAESIPVDLLKRLTAEASQKKILVVCGGMQPSSRLNRTLGKLATKNNVAILAEANSNLHISNAISLIDLVLASSDKDVLDRLEPELIIHLGGAIVSKRLKDFLRNSSAETWYIGKSDNLVDTYFNLSMHVAMNVEDFMAGFVHGLHKHKQTIEYGCIWRSIQNNVEAIRDNYTSHVEWSELCAYNILMQKLPSEYNIQVSNGSAIRYIQYFDCLRFHTFHCNRGVSGIDGCTSTALGASLANKSVTLLITGDMSLAYDIAPLASKYASPHFKIIVIRNGGGGIFRNIQSTASNPALEKCFVADPEIEFTKFAKAGGFSTWQVTNAEELSTALPCFLAEQKRPALLEVVTPIKKSVDMLRNFIDVEIKKQKI